MIDFIIEALHKNILSLLKYYHNFSSVGCHRLLFIAFPFPNSTQIFQGEP